MAQVSKLFRRTRVLTLALSVSLGGAVLANSGFVGDPEAFTNLMSVITFVR